MEKQQVYIVVDDCGAIMGVYSSEEKADARWEELNKDVPRSSFYYQILTYPVDPEE